MLGPLEVVEHDRSVAVGAPKVRALLVVLLSHRGEVVSIDRLIDAPWGMRASDTDLARKQSRGGRGRSRRWSGHGRHTGDERGFVPRRMSQDCFATYAPGYG
jgi:hypothetical protein